MNRCFVIQPFDRGRFDKRFDDVFSPAIRAVDLEPYRVDRDPGVTIPIETIESEIKSSVACLADITSDNPNVWFELGFSIASRKEVVLVCSTERTTRFPFDVQHRNIITYATESSSDFKKLNEEITLRLQAILEKQRELQSLASMPTQIKPTEGLSSHEMVALAVIAQNCLTPNSSVTPHTIQTDMVRAGYTELAVSLSLGSLLQKEMTETVFINDLENEPYTNYRATTKGMEWLIHNQEKFLLRKETTGTDMPF